MRRFVEQLGYSKAILKNDNEAAALALKEAVRKETSVEIVMEEALVGDHQAHGVAENAVKNSQCQFLALRHVLESSINRRAEGDHQAVPWMVMHVATVINEEKR